MSRLFAIITLIIAFVSVYPFDFELSAQTRDAFSQALLSPEISMTRGDILGNVMLFLPFGFLGVFALPSRRSAAFAFLWLLGLGGLFALALQVAQIALPSRVASLGDVAWNGAGIAIGAAAALFLSRARMPQHFEAAPLALIPALLVLAWIGYRLIPFVPSIDFQSIKNSLKPLLLDPQLDGVRLFHTTIAWALAGFCLRHITPEARYDRFLWAIIIAVLGLEVLIVSNAVYLSGVIGAGLGLLLWAGWLGRMRYAAPTLAALLCVKICLSGLAPFELAGGVRAFGWLPFSGILGGSMALNVLALSKKVFLYGGLIYLLRTLPMPWRAATLITAGVVGVVELLQLFFTSHTPEITDPLIALLIGYSFMILDGRTIGEAGAKLRL